MADPISPVSPATPPARRRRTPRPFRPLGRLARTPIDTSPSAKLVAEPISPGPVARKREQHWSEAQYVDNTGFLYRPHMITALLVVMLALIYYAFTVDSDSMTQQENAKLGMGMACFVFLVLGMIVFPAGPFIRPHPVVWRVAFGISVLYEMMLIFVLFQKKDDARKLLSFVDPELGVELKEKQYAENCEFTLENVRNNVFDIFFLSHFLGWVAKSVMIRDKWICWAISISWELIEIAFTHMLPNFAECWWDQLFLDILITNFLGIIVGHKLVDWLEMKDYKWRQFNSIPTLKGKVKRTIMQFTPREWTHVRWATTSSVQRFVAINMLIIAMQLQELNSFFLKHLLWIPPPNPINVYRLVVWFVTGIPALRQIYFYVTDPQCTRFGTQAWVAVMMLFTEVCIYVKLSKGEFKEEMPPNVKIGVVVGVATYVIASVAFLVHIHNKSKAKAHTK